jgi:hypothetical protein
MAGVASPLIREKPRDGIRFLLGLTVGATVGALVISVAAYMLGSLVRAIAPTEGRLLSLAVICAALGVADFAGRTPQVWRQVPQALLRVLPPGRLGTVWGFDLGLFLTTQKVVSLTWAVLAAVIFLQPEVAPLLFGSMAIAFSLTIAAWSIAGGDGAHPPRPPHSWLQLRSLRAMSGTALLTICLLTATQAL